MPDGHIAGRLTLELLEALNEPYRGLSFRFDRSRDWYLTDDGCAANPVLVHADNSTGVRIKIQVSIRERPIRTVTAMPQLEQGYFSHLDFVPAAIPSVALEEVIAEKIRAASQRSKIRDLYDLAEIARRPLQRDLIRALAVLKLWHSTGPGLDFDRLRMRIENGRDYDLSDLRNLLRRDQNPDLAGMIARVVENFQFLAQMTEAEQALAADLPRRLQVPGGGASRRRRGDVRGLRTAGNRVWTTLQGALSCFGGNFDGLWRKTGCSSDGEGSAGRYPAGGRRYSTDHRGVRTTSGYMPMHKPTKHDLRDV